MTEDEKFLNEVQVQSASSVGSVKKERNNH
jgi:hypothetical protein